MGKTAARLLGRQARHRRLRRNVVGLPERPRLSVFRSNYHLYVQLIDDSAGKTLQGWSTNDERLKSKRGNTVEAAKQLGTLIAQDATKSKITRVAFDRGGNLYHGRVKALAEALREGGLHV